MLFKNGEVVDAWVGSQSPTPWRFSRRMKCSQDLYPTQAGPDPIRNDVPGIRHNQFGGAMNPARMAKGRVFG
jgi:hypothetical protein